MSALNDWKLPARRAARPSFVPMLRWAAAAAALVALGVILGRQTSSNAAEIAALKNSVAELSGLVQRENSLTLSNSVAAANEQTLRLLADYSRLQDAQHSADQQTLNVALRNLGTRFDELRTDLDTVALNTATGFEQTHQNLERVAMLSVPSSSQQQ